MPTSSAIKTPQNQQRLTNVAIVKLKKSGKKFEIATYPNKVMAWRQGIEKDLDEVLQSEMVFVNVSRGEAAKSKDLVKCFGTDDVNAVIQQILMKGQIQESEKERAISQGNMFKEIATIVLEKCVNAETKRPLTFGYVERIIKELQFPIKPEESAKKQALQLIKALEKSDYPIERAQMQVQIRVADDSAGVAATKELVTSVDKETTDGEYRVMVCQIDPGSYRDLDQVVTTKLKGSIEVLQLAVRDDSDAALVESVSAAAIGDAAEPRQKPAAAAAASQKPDGFTTSTAPGIVFPTREALREHMKSDWHKFNLKRRTQGADMLTEAEFKEASVDAEFFS